MYPLNNRLQPTQQKFLIAATLGSTLEFFDFITFIFLSPILAKLFFPGYFKHQLGIMALYLTISLSYLFRPIGGIIIGALSDKFGRKNVYISSIMCMALPSLVIACMPTYRSIGYSATVIIILARILQNISLGGEFPNSITYIVEKFRNTNYFFLCSWLIFGANLGIASSAQLVQLLIKHTSSSFMLTYGWRIPFILGSFIAIIAIYLRKHATESEEFLSYKNNLIVSPILNLIKKYKLALFCGTWITFVISLSTAIFHIFLPNLLVEHFAFNLTTALNISSAGAISLAIFSVLFAYTTKYINPGTIIIATGSALVVTLFLVLFYGIDLNVKNDFNLAYLYGTIIIISIFLSGINGVFFGILVDLFPPQIRCTAVSICYNTAYLMGAGLTPIWANEILKLTGDFRYVIAICLIVSLLFFNIFKLRIITPKN